MQAWFYLLSHNHADLYRRNVQNFCCKIQNGVMHVDEDGHEMKTFLPEAEVVEELKTTGGQDHCIKTNMGKSLCNA